MMRGRRPKLSFLETVKLRCLQFAFGEDSVEVDEFWKSKREFAKDTKVRKGKRKKPRKDKIHATPAAAHRAACRAFYERNKERIKQRQRELYAKKKQKKEQETEV